jgi:hypothetical protein
MATTSGTSSAAIRTEFQVRLEIILAVFASDDGQSHSLRVAFTNHHLRFSATPRFVPGQQTVAKNARRGSDDAPLQKSAGPLIDGPMTRLFPPEQFQFHPLLSDCNKRL